MRDPLEGITQDELDQIVLMQEIDLTCQKAFVGLIPPDTPYMFGIVQHKDQYEFSILIKKGARLLDTLPSEISYCKEDREYRVKITCEERMSW